MLSVASEPETASTVQLGMGAMVGVVSKSVRKVTGMSLIAAKTKQ